MALDRLEDLLLALLSEPFQLGDLPCRSHLGELLERRDVQLVPQLPYLLRTHARESG